MEEQSTPLSDINTKGPKALNVAKQASSDFVEEEKIADETDEVANA